VCVTSTVLHAGRSRVGFFNSATPSSRTMALEFTQHLTAVSARKVPGRKALLARKADSLTTKCEPIV
jgi:hypothetical protein